MYFREEVGGVLKDMRGELQKVIGFKGYGEVDINDTQITALIEVYKEVFKTSPEQTQKMFLDFVRYELQWIKGDSEKPEENWELYAEFHGFKFYVVR